ncbi:hypothetical protein [Stutzerimonas kunmingensis]|uniref:hypothetical protein n=1 Tax=Stutzerimonas kunmingensis TaxID=1211807 RepID=UPI0028B15895|nr:hypothetical protein [Stutzerimonas kunmingensis]
MHTQEIDPRVSSIEHAARLARMAYDTAQETYSADMEFEAVMKATECGELCYPKYEVPACIKEIPQLLQHWNWGWMGVA